MTEGRLRVSTRRLGPGLDALETALRSWDVPAATVLDLRLVAEEVLTNVAKYAHDDGAEHEVRIEVALAVDELVIEFRDDGRPFDPLTAEAPEVEVGGLGLVLVRAFVDTAEYARQADENVLVVRKRLGQRPDDVT
jgi:anti-sigma regulatory factor (Ser/Thr protein kinase)